MRARSSVEGNSIHFYADENVDLQSLRNWNPDDEPTKFSDGIGHNVFELHRRLALNGHPTTCGPTIPEESCLVVFAPQQVASLPIRQFLEFSWNIRRFKILAIRSDFPIELPRYVRCDIEIAPSRTFVELYGDKKSRFVPPLPQRGLRPRSAARGDRISVIGLKANPENIPDQLLDPKFQDALASISVTIAFDSPTTSGGSDHTWNDFQDLDVVLCARRDGLETATKPATKLLNAWAAGVIPIARREPAYTEIATDRVNVVFFDCFSEVPEIIAEIQNDDELRNRLWRGIAAAASNHPFEEQLVDLWRNLFSEIQETPSAWKGIKSTFFTWCYVVPRGAARVAKRAVFSFWRSRISSTCVRGA